MPVSTRSQISGDERDQEMAARPGVTLLRNPHHGLKEKMRALSLFYDQHKEQLAARRGSIAAAVAAAVPESDNSKILAIHHPSVGFVDSSRWDGGEERGLRDIKEPLMMKENVAVLPSPAKNAKNSIGFPRIEAKENMERQIAVYSCPKRAAVTTTGARKLSTGAQSEGRAVVRRAAAVEQQGGAALESGEAGGSRILVFVRLRPMARKEEEAGSRCSVKIVNRKDVYLTEFTSETDYLRLKRLRGRHFCFDAAFPDFTTQHEVYATTTAELVEGVMQGRNGSVFCYGATGAGKTYTMLGTVENPGVMVLAIKDLFSKIRQRSYDGNHLVHLSYIEVYNETVRDLLSPGRPLVLREDKQGIVAAGLTQYRAYSTDEVMSLLQRGNQNRTTEPTRLNETSSRSHAILQVVAEFQASEGGNIVKRVGKLSLIDLAGSERALATDQRSQRSIEGANINRSLLALSSCINALVESKKHIPYRNSKLTQLLKDSLGGPCNTVMIANISPSNLSFGETQNTLHWADRAKEIKTKLCTMNEEPMQVPESTTDQAKLLLELQKENSDLRRHLARNQQKLLTLQAQTLVANSSPVPPATSSLLFSPPCSAQHKTKRSLLSGNCFSTPVAKNETNDVRALQRTVKTLEDEINRQKKDHALQLKQKDEFIRELINSKNGGAGKVVTRASSRKDRGSAAIGAAAGELKSPSHRFLSPVPTAKKRSFWDITAANSPSVTSVHGRKTRSHVAADSTAPLMLLQPGFAGSRSDVKALRRGRRRWM